MFDFIISIYDFYFNSIKVQLEQLAPDMPSRWSLISIP